MSLRVCILIFTDNNDDSQTTCQHSLTLSRIEKSVAELILDYAASENDAVSNCRDGKRALQASCEFSQSHRLLRLFLPLLPP